MEQRETSLHGVLELRPRVFRDKRGFFLETYHQTKLAEIGIVDCFVQDNHSCSSRGTLRGLHYQLRHPQVKLCRVVEGEALDVAVDIRVGSPQFGKWTSVRGQSKYAETIKDSSHWVGMWVEKTSVVLEPRKVAIPGD